MLLCLVIVPVNYIQIGFDDIQRAICRSQRNQRLNQQGHKMKAYRISYTRKNEFRGEEIIRRVRQTFVNPKVAASYFLSVSEFSPRIREISVSDYKLAPGHRRLFTVHA